jgi:hypothetical protein
MLAPEPERVPFFLHQIKTLCKEHGVDRHLQHTYVKPSQILFRKTWVLSRCVAISKGGCYSKTLQKPILGTVYLVVFYLKMYL